MRARVLLVEDDPSVREAAAMVMERADFVVTGVADGAAAVVEALRPDVYDLMVLDLMLPGLDGLQVCRQVRRTSSLPIVMLTARADTADLVAGLELGADDYVVKPFEPAELTARVRAVLRRSAGNCEPTIVEARDLRVDLAARRARRGDTELTLSTTEFRLLFELVRHAGTALSRQELLTSVWGYEYLGDSRLVDMAIKRLRDRLGEPLSPPPYIATIRGVGYRLDGA